MIIDFIEKNWFALFLCIVMYFLGLLSIYLKQRATNLALKNDNKRLIEETEQIKNKYELDIAKRKYQYESKREQYFKYFNLLDSFSSQSINEIMLDLPKKIGKLNEDLINAEEDKQKQAKAISEYTEYFNGIMFKSNEKLIIIRNETNSIKLIANIKIKKLLVEIEENYEEAMKLSSELAQSLTQLVILKKSDSINMLKTKLEVNGIKAKELHDQLVEEVSNELNEI